MRREWGKKDEESDVKLNAQNVPPLFAVGRADWPW